MSPRPTRTDARPIALVGLMGSGKTAVARLLAARGALRVVDLDARLEQEEGATVAELFDRHGEAWFRARERALLERVLEAGVDVLACGGGVVLDPDSRRRLHERCRVVWLEVSPGEAARRVGEAAGTRPLLAGALPEARLADLLEARRALYREVADASVATDGRTPAEVAEAVRRALGGDAP